MNLPVIHRIVTGHAADGRAIVSSDGPLLTVVELQAIPGTVFHEVWHTAATPGAIDNRDDPSYTDIWHRHEGRWRCIAAHITAQRLPAPRRGSAGVDAQRSSNDRTTRSVRGWAWQVSTKPASTSRASSAKLRSMRTRPSSTLARQVPHTPEVQE